MRMVFGFVLVLGLGLAGFAVYMAQDYIAAYQAELQKERAARAQMVPTVEVIVANRPLAYGEELAKEDVRIVKWPENAIPEGAFLDAAALFPADAPPRMVSRQMEKDEAVLAVKVTEPGQSAGITTRLASGMRAFAIEVDVSSGVSGFLRPGDRVDVYWTGTPGERAGEITRLIEPNVPLIAVDQTADSSRSQATIARTVTVEVSPQQVAALAQAQSTGRLSLSLVGTSDTSVAEVIEVDQASLLGLAEPVREAAPVQQEVCTVRTRRGAEVVEMPIPCTN